MSSALAAIRPASGFGSAGPWRAGPIAGGVAKRPAPPSAPAAAPRPSIAAPSTAPPAAPRISPQTSASRTRCDRLRLRRSAAAMAPSIAAYDPPMPIVIDGGMGSELEARGVPMDHEAWCGLANLEAQAVVRAIHDDYVAAGADVIIANTFPTNRPALEAAGYGDRFEEANRAAVAAALAARDAAGRPVTVAGSMSIWGPHEEARIEDAPPPADVLDVYREQARLLADAGVDVIVLEMFDARWAAARRAARTTGLPVWLGVWGRLGADGGLLTPTRRPLEHDLPDLIGDGADAVLVMHSPLEAVPPALAAIASVWDGPRGAYPHSGHFERPNWVFEEVAPSVLADEAEGWVRDGATLVGGCCGTGPEHSAARRGRSPAARPAGDG